MEEILTNPPLKEVIFELHWELPGTSPSGEKFDPNYRRFLARMEESIIDEYPEYRQLPAADIPEKLIPHIVQHQFWTADKTWPVIQVGPGIIAVNHAAEYHWSDFEARISYLVRSFFKAYPESGNLSLNKILLKYVNAKNFDYDQEDVFAFLKDKMKIGVDMSLIMPQTSRMTTTPNDLNLTANFLSQQPKGLMGIRVRRGKIHEEDVLFWELTSLATGQDVPDLRHQDIAIWSAEAHSLISELFFKMIEGELLEEFK